jgi:hypothetical protein
MGKLGFENLSSSNHIYMSFDYEAKKQIKEGSTSYLNLNLMNIEFNTNIDRINSEKATIILNNNFYTKHLSRLTKNESFFEELNKTLDIKKCFIFNKKYSLQGRAYLHYMERYTKDFFNISTFIFLFMFCLFLKIHLCKQNLDYIKKMEFLDYNAFNDTLATPILNKYFFFHYVIFYFSLVFALPTVYYLYFNYTFENCFSFQNYSFESFAYDRKFVNDPISLNIMISDKAEDERKEHILKEMLFYDKYNILPNRTTLNNWKIILYICSLIWSCRYYDVFSTETNVSSSVFKIKLSFLDKIIFSVSITIITGFIIAGLMNYIDDCYLFFLYLFYDFSIVKKLQNLIYIVVFISHGLLYTIIILYSLKNKIVLLYRSENRVFPVNKKRSLIIDFSINPLTNKTSVSTENGKSSETMGSELKENEKSNLTVYTPLKDPNSNKYNINFNKLDTNSIYRECNSNSYSECVAINNSIINEND